MPTEDPVEVELLPPRKVVRILGISHNTLRRWTQQGLIKAIKLPTGQYRYPKSEVLRILQQGAVRSGRRGDQQVEGADAEEGKADGE